eukprot:jgi/Psemu1/661/gm1.661_g
MRFETPAEHGADGSFSEPSLKRSYFLNKKKLDGKIVSMEPETHEACAQKDDAHALLVELEAAALSENNKILTEGRMHANQAADQQKRLLNRRIKEFHHNFLHNHSLTVSDGIGAKGEDNVASMSIILLNHKGWMRENKINTSEMTLLLMDNSGSQVSTTMTTKIWQYRLGTAVISVQDLQKRGVAANMDQHCVLREALQDFVSLNLVAPTGIKEMKQIELYTEWRKLVPAEFVGIICPYPGYEVIQKFKEERKRKTRKRSQRKRDSQPKKKLKKTQ